VNQRRWGLPLVGIKSSLEIVCFQVAPERVKCIGWMDRVRKGILCVCLSVCLSSSCSNFWKPWPRNFVFYTQIILRIFRSCSLCQGHWVKVKVTWAERVIQALLNTYIYRWYAFNYKAVLSVRYSSVKIYYYYYYYHRCRLYLTVIGISSVLLQFMPFLCSFICNYRNRLLHLIDLNYMLTVC